MSYLTLFPPSKQNDWEFTVPNHSARAMGPETRPNFGTWGWQGRASPLLGTDRT